MAQNGFQESLLPMFPPTGDEDEAQVSPLPARLPSYIADHRKRLRDRFMTCGASALPDYELLELLLFRAIPRMDVKPLARLLLDTFGDFNRVISASPQRLAMVKGVGDAVIQELKIVEAAAGLHARQGLEYAGSFLMERASGLLPDRHGPPRNRTIPHPVSGPQERADRR